MGLSKVKSSKQKTRLDRRIADWEKIGGVVSKNKKGNTVNIVNKCSFTKPGSNKK